VLEYKEGRKRKRKKGGEKKSTKGEALPYSFALRASFARLGGKGGKRRERGRKKEEKGGKGGGGEETKEAGGPPPPSILSWHWLRFIGKEKKG